MKYIEVSAYGIYYVIDISAYEINITGLVLILMFGGRDQRSPSKY